MRSFVIFLQTFLLLAATPVVAADVAIVRDNNGMPHVYGGNNAEVFFGFGYIMAKDRLFQMEMRKRQAKGATAEILGAGDSKWPDKYLSKDRDARLNLDRQALMEEYDNLPSTDKQLIASFVGGINTAVQEMLATPEKLPSQFKELNFLPSYWSRIDALMVAVDVLGAYSSFTTQMLNLELYEFLRQKYPQDCDDIFNQLMWRTDPNAPTALLDHQRGGPSNAPRLGCSQTPANQLRVNAAENKLSYVLPPELEPQRASMAWITGMNRTQGFRSIFINGPQPGWHSPSYYYPVGLHGGDFDVIGFAAEGSFVLEVGSNPRFSWGLTAGLSAQVDIYQEELAGDGVRYKDGRQDFTTRTEVIKVKGAPDDVFVIASTGHGPVVARDDKLGVVYTQKVAWQGQGAASTMAWVNAGKTQDRDSWLAHARAFEFNYNWFYADSEGYAGYVHTGLQPRRNPNHDHRLPASGTGAYEWLGRLPANDNPTLMTPEAVINFNNKPTRNWPNSGLYWEQWSEANQTDILIDAMSAKQKLSWNDMWAINRVISYTDVSFHYFRPFLEKALQNHNASEQVRQAITLMLAWNGMRTDDDGDGRFDHAGQTLFDAWLPTMVRDTLAPTLAGFQQADAWLAAGYQTRMPRLEEHPSAGTQVLYHALLSSEGRSGVPHHYDFFAGKSPLAAIVTAVEKAVAGLQKKYQGAMADWKSRAVEQAFFDSNANRIPMTTPGVAFTLPLYANRGAMNLMVAYGENGARRVAYVNPPGQVGNIPQGAKVTDLPLMTNHLGHYRDQQLLPARVTEAEVLNNQHLGPGAVQVITMSDPTKPKL